MTGTTVLSDAERKARLYRPDTFAEMCTAELQHGAFLRPKHIRYWATQIVRAVTTPGTLMTIEGPVRHGKSELFSRWTPAWFLGCFPDRRVMLASYEADFASSWGGKARDILEEHGHHYGVRVNPASSARDRWDILGTAGGMITAGVGGALTGRGAHLLLIDDPFKNAEEAMSPVIRAKRWEWLQSTALTRLEPGGVAIILQARWHEDDFVGRLHSDEFTPPGEWQRVRTPALAEENDPLGREEGEALWPERYDREHLEKLKVSRGTYWFGALYQQKPVPAGGGVFQSEHFRTWKVTGTGAHRVFELRRDNDMIERYLESSLIKFQVWDLAASTKTSADYTVCQTWLISPKSDLILIDQWRKRIEGADHLAQMQQQYARHLPAFVGIEKVGMQLSMVQTARRAGLPVKELTPDGDKFSRALSAATFYEAHQVWHPPLPAAPWLAEFELELVGFPTAAHDDQVDCVSYAASEITSSGISQAWREMLEAQLGEDAVDDVDPQFVIHW